MERELQLLVEKFEEIKSAGFHKAQRKGSTGIGYTFEALLGKNEDSNYTPDYNGIEIKAKLGYSKSPVTLFSLVPESKYKDTIKYLVDVYGYPDRNYPKYNVLRALASSKIDRLLQNRYFLKLDVDWEGRRVKLIVKDKSHKTIDDEFYWEFGELEKRLCTKLKYMALVIGYPYRYNGETYYKYFNMYLYRLKGFYVFLKMIESGEINVVFNVGIYTTSEKLGNIYDHGTAFKIDMKNIYKLFERIYIK